MGTRTGGVALFVMALCANTGCSTINSAASFTWPQFADTDVNYSEFFANDHTVAAWFMLQHPFAHHGPIVAEGASGDYFLGQDSPASGPTPRLRASLGGKAAKYTIGTLAAGTWHHVALVRKSGDFALYYDGALRRPDGCNVDKCAWTKVGSATPPQGALRFGRRGPGQDDEHVKAQFYGLVDDVAVFDSALSDKEISALANDENRRLDGDEKNLIAAWIFDKDHPTGFKDAVIKSASFASLVPTKRPKTTIVSEKRQDTFDAKLLPHPVREVRLPIGDGEWKITQGYGGSISHYGGSNFCYDLALHKQGGVAVKNIDTRGQSLYAVVTGTVRNLDNAGHSCSKDTSKKYGNGDSIAIVGSPLEGHTYMHIEPESASELNISIGSPVEEGQKIAEAGCRDDCQANCHLHFGRWYRSTVPPGGPKATTIPVMFLDYEVKTDGGWVVKERGVPQTGDIIRPHLLP